MNYRALSTLLLLSVSCFTFAADLNGHWLGKFGPESEIGLNLKTEAKKMSGTIYTPDGEGPISNGKFTQNTFSFTYPMNGVIIQFTGSYNGDSMELSYTMQGKEVKGTLSRMKEGEPLRITPRMRPQMTEYWEPVPKIVDPGPYPGMVAPPSDAIVLFDGKDLSKWKSRDGSEAKWKVENGLFTVVKGTGDITTKEKFGDYQLHIEWKIPEDIQGQSQARGNSGIFLQDLSDDLKQPGYWYEVQVLDNYNNATYVNGQAGSVYKQNPPLVNAMRKPGEWNVYDITYTAPRFKEDGTVFTPARVSVIHNGILVQNDYSIRGHTAYIGHPHYFAPHGKAPLSLQDHGDPSKAISFRNIWLRKL
ncbi:MAG TPA: DUF1080 domain-containing protein [Chryseolinea sp.]|nr:DUF1080 domain-containing protein [Chryseolinea sp.]